MRATWYLSFLSVNKFCFGYSRCIYIILTKKITYVDDIMIHNFVKYLVQIQLRLWDIKITNFKPESCPDDLLEIYYFYISQTKLILDKIFYKVVYHHIIYMCDFFGEFRRFFCRDSHGFSRRLWFPPDMFIFRQYR